MPHASVAQPQQGDPRCALAHVAEQLESALRDGHYLQAERLIEADPIAAWFSHPPTASVQALKTLAAELPSPGSLVSDAHRILTGLAEDTASLFDVSAGRGTEDCQQRMILSVLRMGALRVRGELHQALEHAEGALSQVGAMQPVLDASGGWALFVTAQAGTVAMLAGDFSRAQALFTQAQLQVAVPKFAFLSRAVMIRSALIHACFGDINASKCLLSRADQVRRTSSWLEENLDAQRDLAEALVSESSAEDALHALERINLHAVGEMWPFYMLAFDRLMKAADYRQELRGKLHAFDSMPLSRVDRQGFSGSVLPLKRALIELESGRTAEAQLLLLRADPDVTYTRVIAAAAHLYAGRPMQAVRKATSLREASSGLRLVDLRRLAVIAAGYYLAGDIQGCIAGLKQAARFPRGLTDVERRQFCSQVRRIGQENVEGWDDDGAGPSLFLADLPSAGWGLTPRETEIIQQLAQGLSRSAIAEELFISVNTLKTQLQSLYRKLGVSSAAAAIREAERRGLV